MEVKKGNEPYFDEGNYLCLVRISGSEINKKIWLCKEAKRKTNSNRDTQHFITANILYLNDVPVS